MTDTIAPTFRTGGAAAKDAEDEARKEAASRRSGGLEFFSLDDGHQVAVRLLTDSPEWIWVDQHSFVPTKPKPKGAEKWPTSMTAVCRRDEAFSGLHPDCYICDNKEQFKNSYDKLPYPQIRIWALAVEREIVKDDNGRLLGTRDKIVEIEKDGTTHRHPKIIVINQPLKSFFGHLQAVYGLYGSVCDRDYVITREGVSTDTTYRVNPLDPIADLKPNTPKWARYEQSIAERGINLGAIVAEKASDQYYGRFFDPRVTVDKDGNITPVGDAPAANKDLSDTPRLSDDLRSKIRNMGVPSDAAPVAAPVSDEPPY